MSLLSLQNIVLLGAAGVVPEAVESNRFICGVDADESERLIRHIGISERHISKPETCASDLGVEAARRLMADLAWHPEQVDVLIFASQTGDYIRPSTSCLIHHRLGCAEDCLCLDIPMGCAGSISALAVAGSLMSENAFQRGLVIVAETASKYASPGDKSLRPLSGDGACALALERREEAPVMHFDLRTDGSHVESVYIPDGGYRNFLSNCSFEQNEARDGVLRRPIDAHLDGSAVFTFSITKPVALLKDFMEHHALCDEDIDYFVLHQANMIINATIARRMKIRSEKMPMILGNMGNTGGSSIPLTLCSVLQGFPDRERNLRVILCGFGSGLCWGVSLIEILADVRGSIDVCNL
ncbi:ketoacyl-ACP synthase III [Haematospirillum sp. H1815]|uniref:ketoacyl-ACP synthase III n=1 Tax=Haematospirillum sp. H1815 TaxID=2723108 RepID=UPI00143C598F|nr:ketoacyl-ACP synthase III [Haematospirillum sp. H1815]NKD77971.1 ketoacyl-ACP synthase III [Haematospirillum sp. H1815]